MVEKEEDKVEEEEEREDTPPIIHRTYTIYSHVGNPIYHDLSNHKYTTNQTVVVSDQRTNALIWIALPHSRMPLPRRESHTYGILNEVYLQNLFKDECNFSRRI